MKSKSEKLKTIMFYEKDCVDLSINVDVSVILSGINEVMNNWMTTFHLSNNTLSTYCENVWYNIIYNFGIALSNIVKNNGFSSIFISLIHILVILVYLFLSL